MRNGLSAGPLPRGLLYGAQISQACDAVPNGFSPLVAYAIAFRETIRGQIEGLWPDAATVMSLNGDGGHGLFQITVEDWWTSGMTTQWASFDWKDPVSNGLFAVKWFLLDAESYWANVIGLSGDALIKCIADEFNDGRTATIRAHAQGNADGASTGGNYGSDVVANYHRILAGQSPV
jgi:hypothetical protein